MLRRAGRRLATRPAVGGFFELRTDAVLPGSIDTYLKQHNSTAAERKKLLPGWLGMWKTELGGSAFNVHHLYHWQSYDERDASAAGAMNDHPMWLTNEEALGGGGCSDGLFPLPSLRDKLHSSSSVVMMEATDTLTRCGLRGAGGFATPAAAADGTGAGAGTGVSSSGGATVAWELRTYQLVLGYPTVPKFLELYESGLRDKLAADDSGASELATLLYSDCGSLNVVMELWRHESLQRAQVRRDAHLLLPYSTTYSSIYR